LVPGAPSVFGCDGSNTVGAEKPNVVKFTFLALTAAVTVKLEPVTKKRKLMSPFPVLLVGELFGTLTMEPLPLVSVSTNCVVTAQLAPQLGFPGPVEMLSVTLVVPVYVIVQLAPGHGPAPATAEVN